MAARSIFQDIFQEWVGERCSIAEDTSPRLKRETNCHGFSIFFCEVSMPVEFPDGTHDGTHADAETLIVGGGIVGLSIAFELSKRGQQVSVLEKQSCGSAASWAGVGILPPAAQREIHEPIEQLRTLSHKLHAQWATELRNETGIDNGWRNCGGIYLATTAGEAATLQANHIQWQEMGISTQQWTVNELVEREPKLRALACNNRLRSVYWLRDECQIRTPHHMRALKSACIGRGVRIIESCEVTHLGATENRCVTLSTSKGPMSAQNICVTAGPWSRQLLQELGVTTGILPVRGQVVLFHPREKLLTHIINEGHRYLVARDDGRILVGSNEEEVGFVCETTEEAIQELCNWSYGILPQLAEVPIERTWAGLRPASFDSYPYIGKLPGYSNLYMASGHFRAGIHLSCGTAVVLADLITTGSSRIDLTAFRPGRG